MSSGESLGGTSSEADLEPEPEVDTGDAGSIQPGEPDAEVELENEADYESAEQAAEFESELTEDSFRIRPRLEDKFKPLMAKELIHNVLYDQLSSKEYDPDPDNVKALTMELSNTILEKVKSLNFRRYKLIAHVALGPKNGAGLKSGFKCIWDTDADSFASDSYVNESLFCHATVYAVYTYN